jgi:hypothetical protein
MVTDNWLDTTEKLARIVSIAAIPVVIAIGGWLIQRQLQDQAIRRDYVQLSLSILQNPDPSKVPPEIRTWAVDLLTDNSPTKFDPEAIQKLKSGAITLSGFSFVPSSELTPELQRSLEASFKSFKAYLLKLGFTVPPETVSVKISPGTLVDNYGVALWDPQTHSILVASAFATDEASILRQFAHNILVPGTDNQSWDYDAIESGLATYFPCSFRDSPMLGDKASGAGKAISPPQDLGKHRNFAEIRLRNWGSVQRDGSEVWGGAFWEIRQLLGVDAADRFIATTWQTFAPGKEPAYTAFARALLAKSSSVDGGSHTEEIREILKRRGLRL